MKMTDRKYYDIAYPLADVKCMKDNGRVIKSMILDKIDEDINWVTVATRWTTRRRETTVMVVLNFDGVVATPGGLRLSPPLWGHRKPENQKNNN